MADHPLKIVAVDNNKEPDPNNAKSGSPRKAKRQETQAYFDRLWLIDSEHMNPERNCRERERLSRTMQLISQTTSLENKKTTDLGCGMGVISRRMRDAGSQVDAVDISSNALKIVKEKGDKDIRLVQDLVPMTTLKDDSYDLVLSTELIADLQSQDYRLYFSELSRLVKAEGFVVCSTDIDINSQDALERFGTLSESEFKVEKWVFSHHLLHIRLSNFFKAPSRFVRASKDPEYKQREINRRLGFNRWWFRINSHSAPAIFWQVIQYPLRPLVHLMRQNRTFLLWTESVCRFFWSNSGISNALFIGQRRPLFEELPANEIPKETKHKKQVWE